MGIGAVAFRHQLVQPTGVGDLQKGEKYVQCDSYDMLCSQCNRFCNMDYIFLSAVRNLAVLALVASYDIACSGMKNFSMQMEPLPEYLGLDLSHTMITYLIPKFHLPGHGLSCQTTFSFNLTPGVGRTDGEGIEQTWSEMNLTATSTKEMGPGACHDTLDDHWGDLNWKHIINFGELNVYLC